MDLAKQMREELRGALGRRGMKQGELAEAMGYSSSRVSRMLSGETPVRLTDMDRAAKALGMRWHGIDGICLEPIQ